jgi:hypothetical protein
MKMPMQEKKEAQLPKMPEKHWKQKQEKSSSQAKIF